MRTKLEQIESIAKALGVLAVSEPVLRDPRFGLWSGASKENQHHYGEGGLATHTLEVIELCLLNNKYFLPLNKSVNEQALFLAALYHDTGKMWDYEQTHVGKYDSWRGTTHKRQIHHISRSALFWNSVATRVDFWSDSGDVFDWDRDDVLHAILAHHGQREWGSPVSPNSRLAWLLHLCDGMSARLDDVGKFDRR